MSYADKEHILFQKKTPFKLKALIGNMSNTDFLNKTKHKATSIQHNHRSKKQGLQENIESSVYLAREARGNDGYR